MRYLTPEGKAKVIAELAPCYWPGARNPLDPLVGPWLTAINEQQNVVTLQSCQGHNRQRQGKDRFFRPAFLWLWFSEDRMQRLYPLLPGIVKQLSEVDLHQRVQIFWTPPGQEIVEFIFCGEGHGKGKFEQAMTIILLGIGNEP